MNSIQKQNTALLIIDMQKNVVANAYQRDQVIQNINHLVERARTENILVVWVQHSSDEMKENTQGWQIVPELRPISNELMIHKVHGDSFEGTNLQSKLEEQQISRLVVTGAQTDACIRSTIHGAFARGYDTVLVSDAHTTEDLTAYGLPPPQVLIEFTNTYWTWQTAPGKKASVAKTADVRLKN